MKHLLIVERAPTQFDAPLYNYLASSADFRLTVVYTQTGQKAGVNYDPEIGRAPQWDHVTSECYNRIDLSSVQARRPAEVAAMLIAQRPDLVLISGYFPPLHRKMVGPLKKRRIKVGLRSDNTLWHSDFGGIKGLAKKLLLPIWLRRYDSWHPVGSLSSAYLESVSRTHRPTYLFPYNVDNEWFATQSARYVPQRQAILLDMGFPADSFVVLGILKWHVREDPLLLVRAFRKFIVANPDARLILVGDGPLRGEVMQMLEDITDKTHLPGYVPYSRLPRLYAMADIFVHPAPGEPWGVSVNEALACGVPVIVSAGVGAGKDLVEEGKTGWVFPAGDGSALVERLLEASRMQGRHAMREACRIKMRDWSYARTSRAFHSALNGEP